MSIADLRGATVRRAAIRCARGDALAARRRTERLLAGIAEGVPGLDTSAILCVRRVSLRVPVRSGSALSASRALCAEMERYARGAAHPALGPVPPNAEAIVFADEAELAACLVRDWLHGRVADRWWWHSVLGDLSPPQWLRQHVLARGEVMVPTMAVLAGRSLAVAWLARLGDAEAEEAMAAIERTHALALGKTQYQSTARWPRASDDHPGLAGIADSEPQAEARSVAFERLITTVPEARAPSLRSPQRRLLALSLALTRSPSWARTRQLAIALQALASADVADHAREFLAADAGQAGARNLLVAAAADSNGMPKVGESEKAHSGLSDTAGAVTTPPRKHEETQLSGPTQASPADLETLSSTQNARPMVAQAFLGRELEAQKETLMALAAMSVHPEDAAVIEDSVRVHTEFGGIFYLLNVAIALELYSDFTSPMGKNLALSPWDWLALVGRAWFGTEFVRDPVWKVLAQLAGRTVKDAPDRDFTPPPDWRIDPDWLAPWGAGDALRVRVTPTRLRLLHTEGFAVFDVARDPAVRPLAQARALCTASDALRGVRLKRGRALQPHVHARARTATTRWLQCQLDYLRARLALALGADGPDDVPALLCCHPAEIAVSESNVHVHLALAGLPLPIRFAGLDRDPGWVPAAGRTVHFHFA